MRLMTKEDERLLLEYPIGSQDETPVENQRILLRFYLPMTRAEWYVSEGSKEGDDWMFFGYVVGVVPEWGYFRLSEVEAPFEVPMTIRGVETSVPVQAQRDESFRPCLFREIGCNNVTM